VVDVGEDLEGVPERIRMPRLAALPPPPDERKRRRHPQRAGIPEDEDG